MTVPVASTPPPAPKPTVRKSQTTAQLEYQIGARIGPVIGAIAILTAIVFLVSLGVQRGVITPAMLFGMVSAGCLAMIGVGQWKRNEREQFGQILTGIGSCGLYINFAAGHVYQNLYSGETLVALFMGLSLVNLGYAAWRSSKSFLSIGILGGLVAAMMPMDEHKILLDVVLQVLILVPATLIIARNRWAHMAIAMYVAGFFALVPASFDDSKPDLMAASVGILITTLLACGANLWADRKVGFDPQLTFIPSAFVLSGLMILGIRCEPISTALLVATGLAAVGLGYSLRSKLAGPSMMLGGVLVMAVLAPIGLKSLPSFVTYLLITTALSAYAYRSKQQAAGWLSTVTYALTVIRYLTALNDGLSVRLETAMLVALMLLTFAVVVGAGKSVGSSRAFTLGGILLVGPMIVRVFYPGGLFVGSGSEFTLVVGLTIYSLFITAYAVVSKHLEVIALAWPVVIGTALLYCGEVALFTTVPRPAGLLTEIALLTSVFGALVASRSTSNEKAPTHTVGSVLLGVFALRFIFLALVVAGVETTSSLVASFILLALVSAVIARRVRVEGLVLGAVLWWLAAYVNQIAVWESGHPLHIWEWPSAIGLLVSLVVCVTAVERETKDQTVYWAAALAAWPIFNHIGWWIFGHFGLGLNDNAAVSTSWITYAVVLLATGFLRDKMHVRLTSFMVVAVTIGKIGFVDLANTDQAVKALVLIFLGLVTLGGGYWYIRAKGKEMSDESNSSE